MVWLVYSASLRDFRPAAFSARYLRVGCVAGSASALSWALLETGQGIDIGDGGSG
jgi:hypothetical protein